MSLIHWWPLNGNLKDIVNNNDLQYTYNSGSISANTNGKIGSCYERTEIATTDLLRTKNKLKVMKEESICAWVYVLQHAELNTANGLVSNHNHNTNSGLGIGVFTSDGNNYYVSISAGNGSSRTHSSYYGKTNIKNAWHHVCMISDGSTIRLYVDGKEDREPLSYTLLSKEEYLDLFNWSIGYANIKNFRPICKLNDVRVYDHALSQAEVKELSKALVVHYTFNDVLAEPTTNIAELITSGSDATWKSWSSYDSYWKFKGRKSTSLKIYRPSSSTSTIVALQNSVITNQMAKGEIWTFSCYLYKNGTPYKTSNFEISSTNYNYKTISCEAQDNGYYSNTFEVIGTPGAWIIHSNLFGSVDLNIVCELRYIQFEKKDHATPYVLSSRASLLYNETGLSQPTTKNNVLLSTDSGTGMYSLKCQGNTEIITSNACDISQGVTVSFWVKCSIPTDSRLIFADSHSQTAFGFYNNGQAIITCAGYGHACVSNIRTNWKFDWNHIIVQRNSSGNVSCYLNGVQLSLSGSQEWTHSVTDTLSIGCRYSGGWTSYFSGLIDDFRFYATCLSLNDIKDLYQTKACISDKGDIMCNEFIEGKSQAQVTSKGAFEANEFYEEETNASIYYNQNVSGRNLIEI